MDDTVTNFMSANEVREHLKHTPGAFPGMDDAIADMVEEGLIVALLIEGELCISITDIGRGIYDQIYLAEA
jgi:hypothetical protein